MIRTGLILQFLLLCILSTVAQTKGKSYALVVGIAKYQDTRIPQLAYSDKDATIFADYLKYTMRNGIPDDRIRVLINSEATIAAVYEGMNWLKKVCRENDTAYIYFSGHGDIETIDKFSIGYLLAYNSPPNNYRNNAIRLEDLNKLANEITLEKKGFPILITDACHSGKLAGDFFKGKQFVADQLNKILNNEVRLTACRPDQLAAEGPNWGGGRGVFSYYLIKGLSGLADEQKDGKVSVAELTKYMQASLGADKIMIRDKLQQNPVIDGHPAFPLSYPNPVLLTTAQAPNPAANDAPLAMLSAISIQPIDAFFKAARSYPIENTIDFKNLQEVPDSLLPFNIIQALIDSNESLIGKDTLQNLLQQLRKNRALLTRFNTRFVQLVHDKAQEMINAYLEGDLAEIEKRQYYYSGTRNYRDFLPMLNKALSMIPPDHELSRIMTINSFYLTGLIDRLDMATAKNYEELLKSALKNQRKALALEPYAAYILNEIGNLQLYMEKADSAAHYFHLANTLSPTWAIPWSNQVRVNYKSGNIPAARSAIHIADSLQPNLAFTNINAGLVMEKDKDLLAAISYYEKAIRHNPVHYLPYEKLGLIYIRTGEYESANNYLNAADSRKEAFAINDQYFGAGPALMVDLPQGQGDPVVILNCPPLQNKTLQTYHMLAQEMAKVYFHTDTSINVLLNIHRANPGLPLTDHYLAKQFYRHGQWDLALQHVRRAMSVYRNAEETKKLFIKRMYGDTSIVSDTCLLEQLMKFHYEPKNDLYILAGIFERKNQADSALKRYDQIIRLENQQLERFLEEPKNFPFTYEPIPTPIGGTLKKALLLEKLQRIKEAEITLINQVDTNRKAAQNTEFDFMTSWPGSFDMGGRFNTHSWLKMNRQLENSTYDFYQRMITRYPRDRYWQHQLAFYLYPKLQSAYRYLPAAAAHEDYIEFLNQGNGIVDTVDKGGYCFAGTGELCGPYRPDYDPVAKCFALMTSANQLSGDLNPSPQVTLAFADLHAWRGSYSEAITLLNKLLDRDPKNVELRNKLIGNYAALADRPNVKTQLELLFKQGKVSDEQKILLAEYEALSSNFDLAKKVLETIPDGVWKQMVSLKLFWLARQNQQALQCLTDTIPTFPSRYLTEESRVYAKARTFALLGMEEDALHALEDALKMGFPYRYVFENDEAWDRLRTNEKWTEVMKWKHFNPEQRKEVDPVRTLYHFW